MRRVAARSSTWVVKLEISSFDGDRPEETGITGSRAAVAGLTRTAAIKLTASAAAANDLPRRFDRHSFELHGIELQPTEHDRLSPRTPCQCIRRSPSKPMVALSRLPVRARHGLHRFL